MPNTSFRILKMLRLPRACVRDNIRLIATVRFQSARMFAATSKIRTTTFKFADFTSSRALLDVIDFSPAWRDKVSFPDSLLARRYARARS